jgi:hypothetical protein
MMEVPELEPVRQSSRTGPDLYQFVMSSFLVCYYWRLLPVTILAGKLLYIRQFCFKNHPTGQKNSVQFHLWEVYCHAHDYVWFIFLLKYSIDSQRRNQSKIFDKKHQRCSSRLETYLRRAAINSLQSSHEMQSKFQSMFNTHEQLYNKSVT